MLAPSFCFADQCLCAVVPLIGHKALFGKKALLAWTAASSYTGRSSTCSVSASLLKQWRVVFTYHAELADGKVLQQNFHNKPNAGKQFHWLVYFVLIFHSDVVDRCIWITKSDNKFRGAFIKRVQCPSIGGNRNWNPAESSGRMCTLQSGI